MLEYCSDGHLPRPQYSIIQHSSIAGAALGGATPIAMVQNAGMAHTVMCVHARKRGTPDPSPGNPIRHGDEHWEEPWGHFSAVANHAFAAQRQMHDFGTTSEDVAHVAVSTRKHACMNSNATMRKPMTIADHQASRFICEPLRLFDCALESDGGGAWHPSYEARHRITFP